MPYEFIKDDTYYVCKTDFGTLFIKAIDGQTLYITSRGDYSHRSIETGITIRGVNYYATLHTRENGSGQNLLPSGKIWLSRSDFKHPSMAAQQRAEQLLLVVADEFAMSAVGQAAFAEAVRDYRNNRLESLESELAAAEAKVEELKKEIQDIKAEALKEYNQ